jgi:hypothetical protein
MEFKVIRLLFHLDQLWSFIFTFFHIYQSE